MNYRTFFSLLVTFALMGALFWAIPPAKIIIEFHAVSWPLFGGGILIFFPMIWLAAIRWRFLVKQHARMTKKEALHVTLVGCSLNAIAPSKTGDLVKAHDLYRRNKSIRKGVIAVLWEKYYDFSALFGFTAAGMLAIMPELHLLAYALLAAIAIMTTLFFFMKWFAAFRPSGKEFALLMALTAGNWGIQFVQIILFFHAFGAALPPATIIIRTATAIFVGLVPVTLAGMGTRDLALQYLFHAYLPATKIAALGLLLSFRYWFPALLGLPAAFQYFCAPQENAILSKNK